MRRLDELEPAVLHERDIALRQLGLQHDAVMRGAEQNRLLPQIDPSFAMFENLPHNVRRLLVFILATHQPRAAAVARAPQILGESLAGSGDDSVGRLQNRPRAAIVLFELDDRRAGKLRGKSRILRTVAAKGVDRLRVIADDRQPCAARSQQRENLRLQAVRVLVFVHQHAVETAANLVGHFRLREEAMPEQQQVVVVQHAGGFLAINVARNNRFRSSANSTHHG